MQDFTIDSQFTFSVTDIILWWVVAVMVVLYIILEMIRK